MFNPNKFISHFDSHAGFAKASKFEVRIEPPPSLANSWKNLSQELAMQCEVAELPGYAINTLDSQIYGAPMHIAATPSFGDISLDFICSGDMWEKHFFDFWMDYIIPKTSYNVNYKDAYQTTITIKQYSEYSDPGSGIKNSISKAVGSAARDFIESKISSKLGSGLLADAARNLVGGDMASGKVVGLYGDVNFEPKATVIYSVQLINAFPAVVQPQALSWSGTDEVHKLRVTFKYDRWIPAEHSAPSLASPNQNQSLIDKLPKFLRGPASGEVVGRLTSKLRF